MRSGPTRPGPPRHSLRQVRKETKRKETESFGTKRNVPERSSVSLCFRKPFLTNYLHVSLLRPAPILARGISRPRPTVPMTAKLQDSPETIRCRGGQTPPPAKGEDGPTACPVALPCGGLAPLGLALGACPVAACPWGLPRWGARCGCWSTPHGVLGPTRHRPRGGGTKRKVW